MSIVDLRADQRTGWSDQDDDHQIFVDEVNRLWRQAKDPAVGDADLLAVFDAFLSHTKSHFAMEETAMTESGFFAQGCHSGEHSRVLAWLDEIRSDLAAEQGRSRLAAILETEVVPWFEGHLATMDLVTARYILSQTETRNARESA